MNKHTPGPWKLARFNPDRATVEVETVRRGVDVPDQGDLIAVVGAYGATIDDAPDARLIAAAPELLDALFSLLNIEGAAVRGCDSPALAGLDVRWHFDKARAAIAKATGQA